MSDIPETPVPQQRWILMDDSGTVITWRMHVPGGWIYRVTPKYSNEQSMCFVPHVTSSEEHRRFGPNAGGTL